mmetsp:Transcript_85417/g.169435  ORF Transcript_85417/g.169435 Transcript_85417/m.169435 type:complete len:274 (-) Transcript_85417:111-932(-)
MGSGEGGLKHVVKRRVHLERHQPEKRQRLGYLEKHKDYVKRAKDYHKKEDTIKRKERQAYFRNPDEFNKDMLTSFKSEFKGGVFKKTKLKTEDELRLLETQDAQYVGRRETQDRKAIERMVSSLQQLDAPKPNKHTIFVDDEALVANCLASGSDATSAGAASTRKKRKHKALQNFNVAAYFDTHPELVSQKANRLRLKQLEAKELQDTTEVEQDSVEAYRKLLQLQERTKRLRKIREELTLRAQMRKKGKLKKMSEATDTGAAVYRWEYDRKR